MYLNIYVAFAGQKHGYMYDQVVAKEHLHSLDFQMAFLNTLLQTIIT